MQHEEADQETVLKLRLTVDRPRPRASAARSGSFAALLVIRRKRAEGFAGVNVGHGAAKQTHPKLHYTRDGYF